MMLVWALVIALTAFAAGSIFTVRVLAWNCTLYSFWVRVFNACDHDTRVLIHQALAESFLRDEREVRDDAPSNPH